MPIANEGEILIDEEEGLSRRVVAKGLALGALLVTTGAVYHTEFPTDQQLARVYSAYASSEKRQVLNQTEIIPVVDYPKGDINLVSRDERIYEHSKEELWSVPHQDVVAIPENEDALTFVLGEYDFTSDNGSLLLHLGTHGNPDLGIYSSNVIDLEGNTRPISQDSLPNIYSFQASDSGAFTKESLDVLTDHLNSFTADWMNLPNEQSFYATDLYPNEAIRWLMFFSQSHSSVGGVDEALEDVLSSTPELVAAATLYATMPEMLRSLYKGTFSRRQLFTRTGRAISTIAAGALLYKARDNFVNAIEANKFLATRIESKVIDSVYPFDVDNREAEDYLGRVEAVLRLDEDEVTPLIVFALLRDLVATYKEMSILSDIDDELLSVWGASSHDTKIGLLQTTPDQILDYLRQIKVKYPNHLNIIIDSNESTGEVGTRSYSSAIWSAARYETKMDGDRRIVTNANRIVCPKLKEIFWG